MKKGNRVVVINPARSSYSCHGKITAINGGLLYPTFEVQIDDSDKYFFFPEDLEIEPIVEIGANDWLSAIAAISLPIRVVKVNKELQLVCTKCSEIFGKLEIVGMPLSNGIVLDRGIDHALAKHFGFEEI